MFSHDFTYHLARYMIELVLKISFFKFDEPLNDFLDLLVAVLQDKVLAFLHLVDGFDLPLDASHGILCHIVLKSEKSGLDTRLRSQEICI